MWGQLRCSIENLWSTLWEQSSPWTKLFPLWASFFFVLCTNKEQMMASWCSARRVSHLRRFTPRYVHFVLLRTFSKVFSLSLLCGFKRHAQRGTLDNGQIPSIFLPTPSLSQRFRESSRHQNSRKFQTIATTITDRGIKNVDEIKCMKWLNHDITSCTHPFDLQIVRRVHQGLTGGREREQKSSLVTCMLGAQ